MVTRGGKLPLPHEAEIRRPAQRRGNRLDCGLGPLPNERSLGLRAATLGSPEARSSPPVPRQLPIGPGTGGGEFLSSLQPLPKGTFATEGYPPNVPVAREQLEPHGVWVMSIGPDNRIDLPSGYIELITCRHEEFDANELQRVLRSTRRFITQQIGAHNQSEINERFGIDPAPPPNAVGSVQELAAEISPSGLKLKQAREARFREEFKDVGARAWYLRFAPWQVPGFSASKYQDELQSVHRTVNRSGGL
jgi:hypothetical protein